VRHQRTSHSQIVVLLLLSVLLLAPLSQGGLGAWFQSPVSTAMPSVSPVMPNIALGVPRVSPDVPTPVQERRTEADARLFSASVWSSLLPWMAVGVVAFGGLAWVLVMLLSRVIPSKHP
jgi:hypothetical protein